VVERAGGTGRWIQWEIQLIAVVVAVACRTAGLLPCARGRLALLSDAISHAILVGIAVAFLVTGDLDLRFSSAGRALPDWPPWFASSCSIERDWPARTRRSGWFS
jgi:hypothetical protein